MPSSPTVDVASHTREHSGSRYARSRSRASNIAVPNRPSWVTSSTPGAGSTSARRVSSGSGSGSSGVELSQGGGSGWPGCIAIHAFSSDCRGSSRDVALAKPMSPTMASPVTASHVAAAGGSVLTDSCIREVTRGRSRLFWRLRASSRRARASVSRRRYPSAIADRCRAAAACAAVSDRSRGTSASRPCL